MSEIVNLTGLHPPINLPDHSVLLGTFDTSIFNLMKNENLQIINLNHMISLLNELESLPDLPKSNNNKQNKIF